MGFKIKDMPEESRPREKLYKLGTSALSNVELLAIILGTGAKNKSAIELSAEILRNYNLKELSSASINKLEKIKGVSNAKACRIVACFELGRRASAFREDKKIKIRSSLDVYNLIYPKVYGKKREFFYAIYLNTKNILLKEELISIGNLNKNFVSAREILKPAIELSAASIILAHNHPSNNVEPSKEDIALTKKLENAFDLFGIKLLDHVIICDNSFLSLKEKGLI